MNHVSIQYRKTRIGELILGSYDGRLCLMDFRYRRMRQAVDNRIKKGLAAEFREQNDEVIPEAIRQLEEYLAGHRTAFDIPVLIIGTDFQKDVWRALMDVAYGKTVTYTQLAKAINQENAVRAVAGANGANAIAIIIPCHRIVGNSGELTGYGGGLYVKKRLLKLESNNSAGQPPKSIF